jgi:hypothetical protein
VRKVVDEEIAIPEPLRTAAIELQGQVEQKVEAEVEINEQRQAFSSR